MRELPFNALVDVRARLLRLRCAGRAQRYLTRQQLGPTLEHSLNSNLPPDALLPT